MDFTSIHNFYEHLVIDYLQAEVIPKLEEQSTDFFLDVACFDLDAFALNLATKVSSSFRLASVFLFASFVCCKASWLDSSQKS